MNRPPRISHDIEELVPSLAGARARHHLASAEVRRLVRPRTGPVPVGARSAEQHHAVAAAAVAEQELDRLRLPAHARHIEATTRGIGTGRTAAPAQHWS